MVKRYPKKPTKIPQLDSGKCRFERTNWKFWKKNNTNKLLPFRLISSSSTNLLVGADLNSETI